MQGFLIDGYPADVEQAGDFESDISAPSAIIFLEAAPEVLTERLIGRGNFDDNKESTGSGNNTGLHLMMCSEFREY